MLKNLAFYIRCLAIVARDLFRRGADKLTRALVAAALLLSGCANIMYRTDGTMKNHGPYYCTCGVATCVAAPFSDPVGPEGGIAKAICTVILPISVVDLPLEAVTDTLFLPYDIFAEDSKGKEN